QTRLLAKDRSLHTWVAEVKLTRPCSLPTSSALTNPPRNTRWEQWLKLLRAHSPRLTACLNRNVTGRGFYRPEAFSFGFFFRHRAVAVRNLLVLRCRFLY